MAWHGMPCHGPSFVLNMEYLTGEEQVRRIRRDGNETNTRADKAISILISRCSLANTFFCTFYLAASGHIFVYHVNAFWYTRPTFRPSQEKQAREDAKALAVLEEQARTELEIRQNQAATQIQRVMKEYVLRQIANKSKKGKKGKGGAKGKGGKKGKK
ncbi:unnamed protein product [Ectocarpus sp. 12 AP-2014]